MAGVVECLLDETEELLDEVVIKIVELCLDPMLDDDRNAPLNGSRSTPISQGHFGCFEAF